MRSSLRPSLYQIFAIFWHAQRGDIAAARLVASMPAEFFAEADALIEAAYVAGAVDARHQRVYETINSGDLFRD